MGKRQPHPAFLRKSAEVSEHKELALYSLEKKRKEKHKSEGVPPYPPTILDEDQKKRLTKFAVRKQLILNRLILVDSRAPGVEAGRQKEKREQAPALQMELSTGVSIAEGRELSRKILRRILESERPWETERPNTASHFQGSAVSRGSPAHR